MVRSAVSLLAVLILPGFLVAQEATPATYKVVKGDCLWNLAEHFYKDPFQWRRIWEANKDKISDPNLIYPDQVFAIPGMPGPQAAVTGVEVQPKPVEQPVAQPAKQPTPAAASMGATARRHTIFFRKSNSGTSVTSTAVRSLLPAVARGRVYAAPWLRRGDGPPGHLGTVVGHAGPIQRTKTFLSYDRVRLEMPGHVPGVGDELLAYHVERTIPEVGQVVTPTGVVTVTEVEDTAVVGVVTSEFGHLRIGDFVGPVPAYSLEPGQMPQAVANGPEAMVMGMADLAQVAGMGEVVFLDLGADDGIAVGDEFEVRDWSEGGHVLEGTLQVVGVKAQTSAARVVYMKDNIFHQGLVVRLARKMD